MNSSTIYLTDSILLPFFQWLCNDYMWPELKSVITTIYGYSGIFNQ